MSNNHWSRSTSELWSVRVRRVSNPFSIWIKNFVSSKELIKVELLSKRFGKKRKNESKVQPFAQWRFYTLFLSPKVHVISESKMYTCSTKSSWDKTWAEGRGRKSEPRNETIIRSTWCIFCLLASTRQKKKVNSRFRCLSEYHFSSSMKYSKTVLNNTKTKKIHTCWCEKPISSSHVTWYSSTCSRVACWRGGKEEGRVIYIKLWSQQTRLQHHSENLQSL